MRKSSSTRFLRHRQSQGTRPTLETLEDRVILSASAATSAAAIALRQSSPNLSSHSVSAAPTAAPLPLGGNLNQQTDRIQDHPFVDLVKVTRGFFNLAGRTDPATGVAARATVDANGWPTEDFAFSAEDQSEFGVQITPGTYHLSFTGPAGVVVAALPTAPGPRSGPAIASNSGTVTLSLGSDDPASGTYSYAVSVPAGIYTLALSFTHTAGAVKNIHLIQPGYDPASYPLYTTTYLNLLQKLSPDLLRFMDFTQTNNSTISNWSDRTLPGQPTAASTGVSWEDVISLANDLNKGLWINVPAQASDDYVTQLATLIRGTLNPGLPIYVEYSNEVWNSSFSQQSYNQAQAVAEVQANPSSDLNYDHLAINSSNDDTFAERRYARRALQISNLFKNAWTGVGLPSPINTQVRMVLAGQAANLSRFDTALTYLSSVYGSPSQFFYSLAIAPYFGLNKYADPNGVTGISAEQVLQGLSLSLDNYQNTHVFNQAVAQASAYGLKLDAYEAGEDTYGSLNIAAKQQAVLDPRNAALIERYLNLWYSAGGEQLNWYTLGARSFNTQYGTWSISDDISNYSEPKEQAFLAVENQSTASLSAAADAYVRDGSYASQNFGSDTQLVVKDAVGGGGFLRTSYLKFDLTGVSAVNAAFLQLYGAEKAGSPEPSISVGVYPVAGSTWSENAITSTNAPAISSTPIATVTVTGTTAQQYTLDLTSYIQQQLALGKHPE